MVGYYVFICQPLVYLTTVDARTPELINTIMARMEDSYVYIRQIALGVARKLVDYGKTACSQMLATDLSYHRRYSNTRVGLHHYGSDAR